ncbi:hypothetical protein ACA910_012569 [Epithemia clementina (nom. ined.)]
MDRDNNNRMPLVGNNDNHNDTLSGVESVLAGLKPIQDLAKNWDIDIASCLEEYLNDLVGEMVIDGDRPMSMDESNGSTQQQQVVATKMNFAKAALVLHNSSHVYSRKVEYLHSLVLTALKNMSKTALQNNHDNNNNNKRKQQRNNHVDDDIEEFWEFDPHQEFLLLDDVLPVDKTPDCRYINLAESAEEAELTRRITVGTAAAAARDCNQTNSLTTTTMSRRNSRTMNTLLLSNTNNHSSNTRLGGGASFSSSNTAWVGEQAGTSGVLRLMNGVCEIDETGRLVLPGSETKNMSSSSSGAKDGTGPVGDAAAAINNSVVGAAGVEDDCAAADNDGSGGGAAYDDGDDDGPGFVMADHSMDEGPGDTVLAEQQVLNPQIIMTCAVASDRHAESRQVRFAPDKPDPWALYDPHESRLTSSSSKPLRLGKTLRLPACLQKGGGGEGKQQAKEQTLYVGRSIAVEAFHHFMDSEHNSLPPEIPWTGFVYGTEFAEMARRAQAKRNAERRLQRRRYEHNDVLHVPPETALRSNYADDDAAADDEGYGMEDWGVNDDNDHGDYDGGDMGDPAVVNGEVETNTGITSVDQLYRQYDDTDSQADARTFEELCRAHIAAFKRGAEKYASATHLTKRVDEWQERLAPLLLEEERRPIFDIYTYGQSVVDRLSEEATKACSGDNDDNSSVTQSKTGKNVVPFERVVEGRPSYDVCRLFLATLSLCNSGNVEVLPNDNFQDGEGKKLQIRLLSTRVERPMEAYLAPSAANR